MVFKDKTKTLINWIIAIAIPVLLAIIVAFCFDYYYDLNDDVLMKDILAGVYTGTPEGHNIQMLWPVSAFISLLYKLCRPLPWYGLFLCACHFGCLFLLLKRSVSLCKTVKGKLAVTFTEGILFGALFMEHLVFAQYTVTCTLLGGTAAFLFLTTREKTDTATFIKSNIPSVLLVAAAFLIRSEMLLLVLPMICVAGVLKWSREEKIFTKDYFTRYLTVFGLIILGILIGQGAHMVAYGSPQWKTFTEFFNNRTELYDFQAPPDYEENREFYESIGLTPSEKILLDNYNFGMDEEIDEKLVGEVAAYAKLQKSQAEPLLQRISERMKLYVYRLTHGKGVAGSDYPWNYVVILAYLAVLILAIPGRKIWGILWRLAFLFGVRTVLWMYILLGDRAPERITHSLYLMELCILGAMMFLEALDLQQTKKNEKLPLAFIIALSMLGLTIWPYEIRSIQERIEVRNVDNAPYEELYEYLTTGDRADNFYFIDVYSSVSYSEKMFHNVDNSLDNYDILGGWACKSPLQSKKLAAFHIDHIEEALKDSPKVFFVRKTSEDMTWLTAYYEGHHTPVKVQLTETIAGIFEIYQIESKGSN